MFKGVKESKFAPEVLFNPMIDAHKDQEQINYIAPKPIMFCFKKDSEENNEQKVIYEIDGDKNLFETKVSW